MTQHLIRIVGGPFTGSRISAPPLESLKDGKIMKTRDGQRYVLVDADSGWEAHIVEAAS